MALIGESVMIAFAGLGVIIDKQEETQESLIIYISVPEKSYVKDSKGLEMSGRYLAKKYKNNLEELGIKRLVVKAKIRKDESWSKQDKDNAQLEMKKLIFGSQY